MKLMCFRLQRRVIIVLQLSLGKLTCSLGFNNHAKSLTLGYALSLGLLVHQLSLHLLLSSAP